MLLNQYNNDFAVFLRDISADESYGHSIDYGFKTSDSDSFIAITFDEVSFASKAYYTVANTGVEHELTHLQGNYSGSPILDHEPQKIR